MKCHFKMTGRENDCRSLHSSKWGNYVSWGTNIIALQMSWGDETCFFFFSKMAKALFITLGCRVSLPPPLLFPLHSHVESVNDQTLVEVLINTFVQRQPTSVLMVRRLLLLFFFRMPPATCQKNKRAFAVKKKKDVERREMFAWRK